MAFADEESNASERRSIVFSTGYGKSRFTIASRIASNSLRSEKGAHAVSIILRQIKLEGSRALEKESLASYLHHDDTFFFISIIICIDTHFRRFPVCTACLYSLDLFNPLGLSFYFLRSTYKNYSYIHRGD